MRRVRKLKEPSGRLRYLSDEERERLLAKCRASRDPLLYPIVLLALATGMRRGEIMGLRWSDIDWDRQRAILQHTKNGERRSVPIVGRAFEVLSELGHLRSDGDLIFASSQPGFESKARDFGSAWDLTAVA